MPLLVAPPATPRPSSASSPLLPPPPPSPPLPLKAARSALLAASKACRAEKGSSGFALRIRAVLGIVAVKGTCGFALGVRAALSTDAVEDGAAGAPTSGRKAPRGLDEGAFGLEEWERSEARRLSEPSRCETSTTSSWQPLAPPNERRPASTPSWRTGTAQRASTRLSSGVGHRRSASASIVTDAGLKPKPFTLSSRSTQCSCPTAAQSMSSAT